MMAPLLQIASHAGLGALALALSTWPADRPTPGRTTPSFVEPFDFTVMDAPGGEWATDAIHWPMPLDRSPLDHMSLDGTPLDRPPPGPSPLGVSPLSSAAGEAFPALPR